MTNTALTEILLVEDNPADARLIEEYVAERSWLESESGRPSVENVDRLEDAVVGGIEGFDIVLLDLGLPDSSGLATLDTMLEAGTAPVVVLTGLDDERVGVEAVERGAQDYLVKNDLTPRLLQQTLRYAVQRNRQQEELEQRNAELALLNQVVRHDIRNDVTVILSWSETLEGHVDETGKSYLDRIVKAGEHITGITQTVGDFLDVLEGNSDPDLQPINIEHVLTGEVEKAQSTHGSATITLADDPEVPPVKATDLLSSVFRNLLNNAVRHNDSTEPTVEVRVTEDDRTVTVRIADDGPGIPDGRKDEIFGRGEMGLESSGSGIGLYLVDTLVGMYNGAIEVTDNDPAGTVFAVTLRKYWQ